MNNFDFMNEVVDELCESMVLNPNRWHITTHCLVDTHTGIEYWLGMHEYRCITGVWNGHSTETVFSHAQGKRFAAAYKQLREVKASKAQQQVLRKMQKSEERKSFLSKLLKFFA